ncbi:MAG: ATP synthase F0 subunit B [Desulfosalsimonas sp.]
MVKSGTAKTVCIILVLSIALLHLTGVCALAQDEGSGGEWRPIYDTIMLWVNFGILAYLLYRYGREPFKNFLNTQSAQISDEINKVENKKNEIQGKIEETREQMEKSDERYEQIKARIIKDGERLRQSIIDDAREQAKLMLERERNNAQRRMAQAKKQLLVELADSATDRAEQKLPQEINQEDQSRMIEFYLDNVNTMNA